ncbi:putative phosphatase regulatory subunit-domain-containing protein [Xylaria longipes]|nr:putative phosphatase regulatory subunit-domain-containing protein [Xylaria longipes]
MLMELSSFIGSYIDPNVLTGHKIVAAARGSASSEPWYGVWSTIIFPCFPRARPILPKSNSVIIADFHFTLLPPSPCVIRQPIPLGMPYTPPSHCSPPSSAPTSPDLSRRSSFNTGTTRSRPALPRSASYLTRHRRSASATALPTVSAPSHGSTPDITPPGTSDNLKDMATIPPSAVRQSPPPIADARAMPPGAIISPPESSSEDEGVTDLEARAREIKNIKELKEAISAIPQCRVGSPVRTSPGDLLLLPSQIDQFIETPTKPTIRTTGLKPGRAPSHSRSNTDTNIYLSKSSEALSMSDDSSEQDELTKKPPMVRKKSGELVRPALRPAHLRRPSSMPGTPTFSKAVHFDSHLEHVRHFLQVDRPLAVSTGSSPVDNYDSDTEYPFKSADTSEVRSPPYEWEIAMNNFPAETSIRKGLPVRLERVWMSPDQKSLIGSVSVANLAFQKSVVCRFTFDYWKTTSEIVAEYHHGVRLRETESGHDRFQFNIKLSDMANLEAKTLYLCIRYNVNGLEYWDNNDHMNFQVDFHKRFLPQNGKKRIQGASSRPANALPRSNRRTNPSTMARPKSMPVGALDAFGQNAKMASMDQPIHEFLGEPEPTGLRLKNSKSTKSLPSDNLAGRLSTPSGVAFANRYDFGASLSAAKQAQRSPNSSPRQNDGLYMKAHQRNTAESSTRAEIPRSQNGVTQGDSNSVQHPARLLAYTPTTQSPGTVSPPAGIASASYEEILNKYCFFNGSKQSSPQLKDGTLRSGQYDGADEYSMQGSTGNYPSLGGSSGNADRPHHGAAHHTLHKNSYDTYLTTGGTSSAESSFQGPVVSSRSPNSPDANTPMGNYIATPNTVSNGPVPDRTQYHHIQHMRDRSPFTSAISC